MVYYGYFTHDVYHMCVNLIWRTCEMHSVFLVESGVTLLLDVFSRDESGVDRIESYLSHICLHIFCRMWSGAKITQL
jgi:hypothetical protein